MEFLATHWYITAFVVLIFAGAVWKLFLSKGGRKQACVTVTEDNRIVHSNIPLKLGHLVLDKEQEAYLYCPEILATEAGTGETVAMHDERDAMPICISGKAEAKRAAITKEKVKSIAQADHDRALMTMVKKNAKDKITAMISFILGAFAVVTLIVIIAGIYIVNKS